MPQPSVLPNAPFFVGGTQLEAHLGHTDLSGAQRCGTAVQCLFASVSQIARSPGVSACLTARCELRQAPENNYRASE
jgi:hypothetical protein